MFVVQFKLFQKKMLYTVLHGSSDGHLFTVDYLPPFILMEKLERIIMISHFLQLDSVLVV